MPNDSGLVSLAGQNDVVDAALTGLSKTVKSLPPRLFYDEEGCRLFYKITNLPEYYLTKTELSLLSQAARQMVPAELSEATLVEFGGSEETKARILLDLIDPRGAPVFDRYISIDVAAPALRAMQIRLGRLYPDLRMLPIAADFMHPLQLPEAAERRFGFFPGSTIGNLEPSAAIDFLRSARISLGSGAWLLLGADLRKDPSILLPAYDDAAGVTAEFNLNLLRRLNREADADFDLHAFRHQAIWNDEESRIEMHLVSQKDQVVEVAGHEINFCRSESIHTENSYKHRPDAVIALADAAGWRHFRLWKDPADLFGVFLFRN